MKDIVIIGAGLTGLTTGFLLRKQGLNVLILEKEESVGGAIHSHQTNGYIFEEGPNTGVVSNPEVAELFEMLGLEIEEANADAEKRLILKNRKWYPLPCNASTFMKTPLFSTGDKIKIMFEPFRKKGTDPEESVASLASRRIGQSFVDYAVNPFISGIYAGDPERLITKYALPKLYNLEQNYGSFIGGAYKKSKESKTDRDLKASKKVFSVKGGLGSLTEALKMQTGGENIVCGAENIIVNKSQDKYIINYLVGDTPFSIKADVVISTVGSYALPRLLPFITVDNMNALTDMNYAKIVQVAVCLKENAIDSKYVSFGGLIPQKENRELLGVLFPSFCFSGRAPKGCSVLAIYLGGIRKPELFDLSDENLKRLVLDELQELFDIQEESIHTTDVFRHKYAIPQYEKSSGKRFETIHKIEAENNGLIIAGNLRDGIGMADRIKQAFTIAEQMKPE